jgi:pectate lyase
MTKSSPLLLLLVLLAPAALAQPAPASSPANGRAIIEVRGAPQDVKADPTGAVLGQVLAGQRFVSISARAGATRVDWQGRAGWLPSGALARVTADAVEVLAATAQVRQNPAAGAAALVTVARGQAYVVVSRRTGWTQVQVDRRAGWLLDSEVRRISFAAAPAPTPGTRPSPGVGAGRPSPASLLAERTGFGRGVTGGDPTRIYRVTTLADSGPGSLRAGLETPDRNWVIFDVDGTIVLRDKIKLQSNKTIDGRTRDVTVKGGTLSIQDHGNIIISDIRVTTQSGDAIGIRGNGANDPSAYTSKGFWFHHLELFDSQDGLIDFRGATDITISWCHFHTHQKASLCSYSNTNQETRGMRITAHHNFFERITRRGLEFMYGTCDYSNNLQYRWYEYGCGSFYGAQLLSQANIYEARPGWISFERDPSPLGDWDLMVSKLALIVDWDNRPFGYTKSVDDAATNGAKLVQNDPGRVFARASLPYTLAVEKADSALRARIVNGAGPRK